MGYEMIGYVQIYNKAEKKWEMLDVKRAVKCAQGSKWEYISIWSCGRGYGYHDEMREIGDAINEAECKYVDAVTAPDFEDEEVTRYFAIPLDTLEVRRMYWTYEAKPSDMDTVEEIEENVKYYTELVKEIKMLAHFADKDYLPNYYFRYVFFESC